jgi:hypothetical protein
MESQEYFGFPGLTSNGNNQLPIDIVSTILQQE